MKEKLKIVAYFILVLNLLFVTYLLVFKMDFYAYTLKVLESELTHEIVNEFEVNTRLKGLTSLFSEVNIGFDSKKKEILKQFKPVLFSLQEKVDIEYVKFDISTFYSCLTGKITTVQYIESFLFHNLNKVYRAIISFSIFKSLITFLLILILAKFDSKKVIIFVGGVLSLLIMDWIIFIIYYKDILSGFMSFESLIVFYIGVGILLGIAVDILFNKARVIRFISLGLFELGVATN